MPLPEKWHGQQDRMLVHDDEKNRVLYLRPMELVPPEVGIFDEPTRCYRVNLEWGKIVIGMVSWLAEVAPWRDAENEGYFAIEEILKFMRGEACGSDDMPTLFRQNPTNNCQLQQSTDNGESWSLIFDFSLCELNVQVDQGGNYYDFSETGIATYNDYITNYTTVNEFVPALVYDESGDDFYRDQALCFAIEMFYESIKALHIEYLRTLGGYRVLISLVATAVGALFAFITAGLGTALAVAFGGAVVGAFIAVIGNVAVDWNADVTEADWDAEKDDIICCMYTAMNDATISQSAFENSLLTCDLSEIGDLVALMLQQFLDDDDTFIMFLKLWEEAYRLGQIGILPACPCADSDEPWTYDSDFPVDPNGWFPEVRSGGNAEAVWAETTGWSQVGVLAVSPNQHWRCCVINITFERPVYVGEINMIFNLTKGSFVSNSTSYRINALLENSTVSTAFVNHNDATNGTNKSLTINPEQMIDEIHLLVRSSFQLSASYSGAAKIVSCHIEGTGQIPDELTQTLE